MRRAVLFSVCFFFCLSSARADVERVIKVVFAKEKQVLYIDEGGKRWLEKGEILPPEGEVKTFNGRCVLEFPDGSVLRLSEYSSVKLESLYFDKEKNSIKARFIALSRRLLLRVVKPLKGDNDYQVTLPAGVVMGVRGTTSFVDIDEEKNTRLSSYDGSIEARGKEKISFTKGEGVYVDKEGGMKKVKLPPSPVLKEVPSRMRYPFSIEWEGVPGINAYEVTIAMDKDMKDVIFSGVIYGTRLEFFSFPSGTYFITVQSVDSLGFLSIPEEPSKFEIMGE